MNHLLRERPGEGLGEEMAEDLTLQFDAVFDRCQIAEREHALSTRAWLQYTLRMTGREASAVVQQGRALGEMPLVSERAQRGEVTVVGLKLLTTARMRQPVAFVLHEPVFAEIAWWLNTPDL